MLPATTAATRARDGCGAITPHYVVVKKAKRAGTGKVPDQTVIYDNLPQLGKASYLGIPSPHRVQ